jgi:hypothetical protein
MLRRGGTLPEGPRPKNRRLEVHAGERSVHIRCTRLDVVASEATKACDFAGLSVMPEEGLEPPTRGL